MLLRDNVSEVEQMDLASCARRKISESRLWFKSPVSDIYGDLVAINSGIKIHGWVFSLRLTGFAWKG